MDEVTSDSVNHLNIFPRSEIMAGLRVMIEPLITILSLHRTHASPAAMERSGIAVRVNAVVIKTLSENFPSFQ